MQVRKGIYFKLKNFDRPAKEQRAVFCISRFPRGSGLTGFAGRPFAGGSPGAEEMWIKAVTPSSHSAVHGPAVGENPRASLVRPVGSEKGLCMFTEIPVRTTGTVLLR